MKVVIAIPWRTGTEYRTADSVKDARKLIATIKKIHKVDAYIDSEIKDPAVLKRNEDFFKRYL